MARYFGQGDRIDPLVGKRFFWQTGIRPKNDINNETALHKNPLAGEYNHVSRPEDFNLPS
jgi:hypothetical protein